MTELQTFAEYFTPEIIQMAGVIFLVFLAMILYYVASAFNGSEKARQLKAIWGMVDESVYDVLFLIAFNAPSSLNAEGLELAAEYKQRYGRDLDPRMAYAIKQIENMIENHVDVDFDFFAIHNKAERIYQERVKPKLTQKDLG